MSIELKHDDGIWQAFAGACPFGDDNEVAPFFAEVDAPVLDRTVEKEDAGMLILDSRDGSGVTTLTINLMDTEGFAYTWTKEFPEWGWEAAKAWAERHLDPVMTQADLTSLGFTYEVC